MRRTKIIATLGPATDSPGVMDELILAGVDCARLNCSHSDAQGLRVRAAQVRAAGERAGRPIALLMDLQGPKLRLTALTEAREYALGDTVGFAASGEGAFGDLEVSYSDFVGLCTARSQIIIGDGTPRFDVVSMAEGQAKAVCCSPGTVGARKGVNVTHAQPLLPALTAKDFDDIVTASELDADFVALSFVRTADDVVLLREHLRAAGSNARVIAKIEKVEALENLDAIISASDGVMVARGDYGVEAGLAYVPAMQKEVIHRAVGEGKLVITATQMLESMVTAAEPTRAEALDVFNAILDGTSATMLSAETGVGKYPVQAVKMMAEIAVAAEQSADIYHATYADAESSDAAVMYAAVALAHGSGAAALVVPTTTGGTVRACAKYRPARPIIALCHRAEIARQLALEWGVSPAFMQLTSSVDELVDEAVRAARPCGLAVGDKVVITSGPGVGLPGATNLIVLKTIL